LNKILRESNGWWKCAHTLRFTEVFVETFSLSLSLEIAISKLYKQKEEEEGKKEVQ